MWFKDAKYWARLKLRAYPKLHFPIFLHKHPDKEDLCVTRDSHIVIEGYPRCGNTFAVAAFQISQDQHMKVAHHLHFPSQIIRGVQLGIPTLILTRHPLEAVASLLVRHPKRDPAYCLMEYEMFYRSVQTLKDLCVIADFKEIISNFGAIISRLNDKYKTTFNCFEHTQENVDDIFGQIEKHNLKQGENTLQFSKPSNKKRVHLEHAKEHLLSPKYKDLYNRALTTYSDFVFE